MNVFEMEGFLRGKCLPGDMKVNETTAEYLVRKLGQAGELTAAHSTLEKAREVTNCPDGVDLQDYLKQLVSRCDALTAENAGLKNAITAVSKTSEECEINGDELKYVVEPSEFDALTDLLDETTDTDAFLAEVRAHGVEMFAAVLRRKGDDAFFDAIAEAQANAADQFAAQLRQEAAQ